MYLFVVGVVMSGVGKGVLTASLARMLQERGKKVTVVKTDPYLNSSAKSISVFEHGENYVTYDGKITDMDLGTYSRFLGYDLPGSSSITGGLVYRRVLEKERKGFYHGRTVQVNPHVVEEYISLLPDEEWVVVEVGGTAGDEEHLPFLTALRLLQKRGEALVVALGYAPFLGEPKTKPTQLGLLRLMSYGIVPDAVVVRGAELSEDQRNKISKHFGGPVYYIPDLEYVYEEPLVLEEQGMGRDLFGGSGDWREWKRRVRNLKDPRETVPVKIHAPKSADFYTATREALIHYSAERGILLREGESEILVVPPHYGYRERVKPGEHTLAIHDGVEAVTGRKFERRDFLGNRELRVPEELEKEYKRRSREPVDRFFGVFTENGEEVHVVEEDGILGVLYLPHFTSYFLSPSPVFSYFFNSLL